MAIFLLIFFFFPVIVSGTDATWILNNNGNWNVNANWSPATFPNAVGDTARFLNAITASRTVTLGQNITIGSIFFDSANNYNLTGNTLTFSNGGTANINITNVNGNGNHSIASAMSLTNTINLTHSTTGSFTLSGAISGTGGITKNGTGTGALILSNATNSYTGATNINEGFVSYLANGAIPTASLVTVGNGAAPNATLTIAANMTTGNALRMTINSDGTLIQNLNNTVFVTSLQGNGTINLSTGIANTSLFNIGGSIDTTFSGSITAGASSASSVNNTGNRVNKDGTAITTLTGASSTYVSRTFIANGALNVQNSGALGASGSTSAVYVQGGGATSGSLYLENNINLAKDLLLNGTGFSTTGALRNVSGNNTVSGNVTIGWAGGTQALANASIQVDSGTSLTFSSILQGSRALTKTNPGTLNYTGASANTLTGLTTINGGTIFLNKSAGVNAIAADVTINATGTLLLGNTGQIVDTSVVTLGGGIFNMNGFNETISQLTFTSGTLTQGGATLSLASNSTALSMADGTSITGNIALTGSGSVNKTGVGAQATISGNLDLGSAIHTFRIGSTSSLASIMEISGSITGTGGISTPVNSGLLIFSGTTPNTYTGLTTQSGGNLLLNKSAGVNAISGNILMNDSSGTLTLGNNNQIADTSSFSLTSGHFNMAGFSDVIGSFTYNSGTFVQSGGVLGLSDSTTALTMRNTTIDGAINITGGGAIVFNNAMNGTATFSSTSTLDLGSSVSAISFNINNGTAATDMLISGPITGSGGGLTKIGLGQLEFSGSSANTYSGITTISDGVLLLNKSAGIDAIPGDALISGGTLTIGTINQIADTSSVTFSSGTFNMTFAETIGTFNYDGGTFNQGGALSLSDSTTALSMRDTTIDGAVNITGGGSVIFDNTNNGTATLSSTSTLDLGSSITAISFNISDGTAATDMLIAGPISGSGGGLTKIGLGQLELSGTSANTYAGVTTISNGILLLNKSVGINAIPGDALINGGTLTIGTINQIADTSSVTLSSGTFNMTFAETIGTFNYNGGTFNQGGTISLSDATTALSMRDTTINGVVNITGGGSVVFDSTNNGTATLSSTSSLDLGSSIIPISFNISEGTASTDMLIASAITGSGGGITKIGFGQLEFSGTSANTYTGLTTISNGTLLLSKSAGIDAIPGDALINGGILTIGTINQIPDTATVTLSSGTFNMQFAETIGTFYFNSGTFNQSGTLSLSDSTTVLSMRNTTINGPINIIGSGAVVFDNANNGTATINGNINEGGFTTTYDIADGTNPIDMLISGIISNGGLVKIGDGTLVLTGSNTYSAGTTISGGTLQGNTISLQNNIVNNANLVFDQNFNGIYADMISGTGNFVKQGTGKLTLTNTNSVGGSVAVDEGTLTVNGTLSGGGQMTVASGATLSGLGVITKNARISGTVIPGDNTIGTLQMLGNQVFRSGSALDIEFNSTSRDLLDVVGTLTIQPGATLNLFPQMDTYPDNFTYVIVQTTGGLSGTFTTINSFPLFRASVEYTPFDIALVRVTIVPFSTIFTRGNAAKVAHCLDMLSSSAGSDLGEVIVNLRAVPTIEELEQDLLQLQPSAFTSLAIAQENNALYIKNAIYAHLINNRCNCCSQDNRQSFWISPFIAGAKELRHHQEPGFRDDTEGVICGFDFPQEQYRLGLCAGYNQTHLNWTQNRGKANIQSAYLGVYALWEGSAGYIQSSIIGSANHYATNRHIEFVEIDRHAKGDHRGLEGSIHFRAALTCDFMGTVWAPFISTDYIYVHEQGFKEKGARSLNLRVQSKNSDLLSAEAGIEILPSFCNSLCNIFFQISAIQESRYHGSHEKGSLEAGCHLDVIGINPSRLLGSFVIGINKEFACNNFSLYYQGKYSKSYHDSAVYFQYQYAF